MVDNELHGDLMILVNNAQNRQIAYQRMAFNALEAAKDHPLYNDPFTEREAAEATLADDLKNHFEWMTDDIQPYPTIRFPKDVNRGPKGNEDDRHEERKVMINCLVAHAMGQINWLAMAKEILSGVDEILSDVDNLANSL